MQETSHLSFSIFQKEKGLKKQAVISPPALCFLMLMDSLFGRGRRP